MRAEHEHSGVDTITGTPCKVTQYDNTSNYGLRNVRRVESTLLALVNRGCTCVGLQPMIILIIDSCVNSFSIKQFSLQNKRK